MIVKILPEPEKLLTLRQGQIYENKFFKQKDSELFFLKSAEKCVFMIYEMPLAKCLYVF